MNYVNLDYSGDLSLSEIIATARGEQPQEKEDKKEGE